MGDLMRMLVMGVYLLLGTALAELVSLAVSLASVRNAFSQFIFPFQVFDFTLFYAFFLPSGAALEASVDAYFIASLLLLSVHVTLRNSDSYPVLIEFVLEALARPCELCLGRRPIREAEADEPARHALDDPLLALQYTARLATQYNLADVAATLMVPSMLSLLVLRDGRAYIKVSLLHCKMKHRIVSTVFR